jgi:hypothetical protein
MRTAVVRVDVDPTGALTPARLRAGMTALRARADEIGVELIETDPAEMPVGRRQVQLLITGADPDELTRMGVGMCAKAFGTSPTAGAVTYISRGTDDDAYGVLARFGLSGLIRREPGEDGVDTVYVTLREADLERVPESRIHTALEASLNCEVRIVTR